MTEPAHILVVDDDPNIRRLFHDMLISGGYRVSPVSSGEEALAYLHLITPDLILLDLTLPGIDGNEVIRRLKADQSKPFIPVIVITAQANLETSVHSLDTGADDFLPKPVNVAELLAHVRAMLRLQRAQRSLRNEQRKTELLLHLTRELGSSIDLDSLLTRFLDHLADAVGAVRASIIIVGDQDDHALCYSSSRHPATQRLQDILRQGVAGWALRERKPLVIEDAEYDDRWIKTGSNQSSIRSVVSMPVIRDDLALAVITMVHHTPGYFSAEHTELLSSVALQAAMALQSAQLFRLTQQQKELLTQRAEELRRINQINAHLSELMSPDQLARLVTYMVHQQFGYPRVSMLMREGDELVIHSVAGSIGTKSPQGLRLPIEQGLNGWALHHQQTVRVDDVHTDDRFAPFRSDNDVVRSELVVPVLLRREVLGTLDVQSAEPAAFSQNDEAILNAIVSQVGVALGNAMLLENEHRRVRQLNQVNNLSVAITAQLDTTQNLQLASNAIAAIFGVNRAGLIIFNDEDAQSDPTVTVQGTLLDPNNALLQSFLTSPDFRAQINRLRAPLIERDLPNNPVLGVIRDVLLNRGIAALLLIPLLKGSSTLGLLCVDATDRDEHFDKAELEVATTIGSLIVQVIENTRLYRAVEDERTTLNAVLRSAADAIVLIGPDDELLLANSAAEERLSLYLAQDRGKPLQMLQNGRDNAALDGLLSILTTANGSVSAGPIELELPQDITYSISVAPVRNADGQRLGRVAVLQDITPIKALERQERERVRGIFRRYVSPPVAEYLLSAGQEWGEPTECDVVVLFADLRGFTTLAERTEPDILIRRILNRYFTAMTNVLHQHLGTIDKFLGDGIIGVFGTPIARPDDPQRSVLAAVDMQLAFAALGEAWRDELGLDIGMGIGISYGRAVVGNIGSDQRLDYTLIGDVVNTANRLCGMARAGQIIISYHLYDALPPEWDAPWLLHPLGPVRLKGKQEPHPVFEVAYTQLTQLR